MIEARIRQVFRGFSLDVDVASNGPVLGVFGRSGSGKTTFLHALAGLSRPRVSRVVVAGELLSERPGRVHVRPERRRLALVPQDALLFPHLSVRRNLTYAPGAEAELEAASGRQIVDVLRLGPLFDRNVATLSGGERQRVALGRALLSRPRLLLLDEPAASLDAELAREVLALLIEAKRTLRVPMVLVTHRAPELLALADDCIVLDEGRVVAQGPPVEVLARPRAVGVANLAGVDNLLRLRIRRHEETNGLTVVDLGGEELAVPLCASPPDTAIDVGLYAEDVILCLETPRGVSARNAIPVRVARLEPIGREVLVTVAAGTTELRVRLTPGAATELALGEGASAVALIKTTACHLLSEAS